MRLWWMSGEESKFGLYKFLVSVVEQMKEQISTFGEQQNMMALWPARKPPLSFLSSTAEVLNWNNDVSLPVARAYNHLCFRNCC